MSPRTDRRPQRPHPRRRPQRGVTLVEAAVVVAIVAVVAGTAAPWFGASAERRVVEGMAAQFEADVQYARAEAAARRARLVIDYVSDGAGSCYVLHTGATGDCTCAGGAAVCAAGVDALRLAYQPAARGIVISSNVASMRVDPHRHTVSPTATVSVGSRIGSLRQTVNIMGRVRSCSPAPALPGHPTC